MKPWYVLLENITPQEVSNLVLSMRSLGASPLNFDWERCDCLGVYWQVTSNKDLDPYLDLDFWDTTHYSDVESEEVSYEQAMQLLEELKNEK